MPFADEAAVGAFDRGRERRERGDDDARGKGRGAEAVVDHGCEIIVERGGEARLDRRTACHAQEIGRGRERRIGRHRPLAGARPQQRGNPDRQRRQDFGRRAVVRQRGQTHADAVDRRPACRGRQPLVQPGEGEGAAGAELFDDACAGEAVAGETLPHQGDGALIAALFDQLSDRMTAHQHDAGFGIVVAEHGLARDDAVESITHGVLHVPSTAARLRRAAPECRRHCARRSAAPPERPRDVSRARLGLP